MRPGTFIFKLNTEIDEIDDMYILLIYIGFVFNFAS